MQITIFNFFFLNLLNFFFIFQAFFSLSFFFSAFFDEEFVICLAIFFVFILFINQIVKGVQEMLKSRLDLYLNVFLIIFKLLRKTLKRFQKHNSKTLIAKNSLFIFLVHLFLQNLISYFSQQTLITNYFVNFRFKIITNLMLSDFEVRNFLLTKFVKNAYFLELKFCTLLNSLAIFRI